MLTMATPHLLGLFKNKLVSSTVIDDPSWITWEVVSENLTVIEYIILCCYALVLVLHITDAVDASENEDDTLENRLFGTLKSYMVLLHCIMLSKDGGGLFSFNTHVMDSYQFWKAGFYLMFNPPNTRDEHELLFYMLPRRAKQISGDLNMLTNSALRLSYKIRPLHSDLRSIR